MKYELMELNNLEKRTGFAKFLEILDYYDRAISNPNEEMSYIFALESHIKSYCEKCNLDFYKLRNNLLKGKKSNYTEHISEWNFSNCL